jgi:hypothetical protein
MDVWCVCAFFCISVVLCLGRGPFKESYRLWIIKKLRNQPYAPKWVQEEVKKNIIMPDEFRK